MVDLPKGSAEYINRLNKIKVLNLIRNEGPISRAQIVKQSGISAPTVTRIVDSLINEEELAVNIGTGVSSGGRPPVIVKFNGASHYVIGIDWGRTHIHGVLTNLNAETLIDIDVPTEIDHDFDSDLNKVIEVIDYLIENSGIEKEDLLGIGIAAAGFIKQGSGVIEYSPNFNWENVDIQTPVRNKFGVPVFVDNVSRVMGLGELWFGEGQDIKNFIFVNVGYGIGSGIIINGQPFYGFDEIGRAHV